MTQTMISACFAQGAACLPDGLKSLADIEWTPHPSFKGVSMKHLIRGADTGGGLSCHLVKVAPGCALEKHAHQAQWELHEVVEGSGTALLGDAPTDYAPGTMAVIPQAVQHRVEAGGEGLVLFAKFFPALI